jgi:GTP-binding protein
VTAPADPADPDPTRAAAAGETGPDDAALERGRLLFARPCTFVAGIARADQFTDARLPEIAFAGRSNVGKSSLINALTGRKALARTSQTPGRTREINLFELDGRLSIVDLPGYGYARASRGKIKAWTQLVRDYLRGRATLRRVCVLIDARHGLKDSDHELLDLLDSSAVSYQIVLTKADKLKPEARARSRAAVAASLARHPAAHPLVIATSARDGDGIAELRAALAALAAP